MLFFDRTRRTAFVAVALVVLVSLAVLLAGCDRQEAATPDEGQTAPPGVTGQTPVPPPPGANPDPMASKPTELDNQLLASIEDIDPAVSRVTEEQQGRLKEVYFKGGGATRTAVLKKVSQLKTSTARELILAGLGDQAADVRLEAVKASVGWNDPEMKQKRLATLNEATNGMELSRLTQAMGAETHEEPVLKLMVSILSGPRPVDLKSQAIAVLQQAHYEPAIPLIESFITEGTGVLPELATRAIVQMQVPLRRGQERYTKLLALAIDPRPSIATLAQLMLVEEKSTSGPYVAQALFTTQNPAVRLKAAEIMAVVATSDTLPQLVKAAGDQDPLVQEQVAKAMALAKPDEAAIAALGKLMNSRFDYVRSAAALALSRASSPAALPYLIQGSMDSDEWVRRNALEGLVKLASTDPATSKPALLAAARDTNEYVRASAAQGLGSLGSAEVKSDLLLMLKDSNWRARASAAEALGDLGDRDVKGDLLRLLKSDEPEVQHAARKALRKLFF